MDDVSKTFIDDLQVDGMFHCVAIRSRIRRGTIREIKIPELPPDVVLIQAADLPGDNHISIGGTELPVLAETNVEHPGQAIALLCGEDEFQLQRLAEEVEIQYDRGDPFSLTREFKIDQERYTRTLTTGNVAAAFEKAFQIAEGEYKYEPAGQAPVSPAGAFAMADSKSVYIATPTRWAFHVRNSVADLLGIDRERVVVKCTRTSRMDTDCLWYPSMTAAQTAVATAICGKPVRMIATAREKELLFTRRAGCIISHKTALNKSGKITAMQIQIISESGAFGIFAAEHLDRLCLAAPGYYAVKAVRIDGIHITTSAPPANIHDGIGFDGGFFALEIHASRLAELHDEDPSAWRLQNLLPERNLTVTKTRAGSTPQRKLIESVIDISDFCRKYSANEIQKKRRQPSAPIPERVRGIGMATCFHGGGFISDSKANAASATVKLSSESQLSILTSSAAVPVSSAGMYIDSASRILSVDPAAVQIEPTDTSVTPDSGPAVLSRNVTIVSRLIAACCQAIQKQRFRAPLPMEISRNRHGGRGRRWDVENFKGVPFSPLSWASCVAEIELNTVTYRIDIRGLWISLNLGSVLDERTAAAIVENELLDAFRMCCGYSCAMDPKIQFFQKSGASPAALSGLTSNVFLPALVSALSQATGAYFDSLPISKALFFEYMET